jgi:membrane-bound metal-dependent hydrolase YbcI (DUF457 family)
MERNGLMSADPSHFVNQRPASGEYEVEHGERERHTSMFTSWSPMQIVGLIIGIGITVLGFAAVARTGFDSDHIYTPQADVASMSHTPLFALIEVGFGVLVIVAAVVPGGARGFMALLGAAAVSFGLVVLIEETPNRLNHWLGVEDRNGVFYVVVGGVLLLTAIVSPVFTRKTRRHVVRDEQRVVA